MAIDTWAKWDFEIWSFLCFLEAKVVNLGPTDFKLGLPFNFNRNDGQNKFKVHISKNGQFSAQNRETTFASTLNLIGTTQPFLSDFDV